MRPDICTPTYKSDVIREFPITFVHFHLAKLYTDILRHLKRRAKGKPEAVGKLCWGASPAVAEQLATDKASRMLDGPSPDWQLHCDIVHSGQEQDKHENCPKKCNNNKQRHKEAESATEDEEKEEEESKANTEHSESD